MGESDRIKRILDELCSEFCSVAIDTVEAIFRKRCEVHLPWAVVEQLQGQFDRIMTLGSSSRDYSAITCVGIQKDSLDAFLGQEDTGVEEASDVLGELANTYYGLLGDSERFTRHFGYMNQALPVLYLDGNSFLPFIRGIQGYLYYGNHWLYMGYAIRSNADGAGPDIVGGGR